MKVTVKNPSDKPINISKLAPLMPVQVLGVNQEILVNVRDIDSVTKNAKKIGVTVAPMEAFKVTKVVELNIVDTTTGDIKTEFTSDKQETEIIDNSIETPIETNEVTPEMTEPSNDNIVVDKKEESNLETEVEEEKSKKKASRKSTKAKKTTTKKSIFGNNK